MLTLFAYAFQGRLRGKDVCGGEEARAAEEGLEEISWPEIEIVYTKTHYSLLFHDHRAPCCESFAPIAALTAKYCGGEVEGVSLRCPSLGLNSNF